MATGNMILMDDWVPHIREPSYENRSKLADVVKKLSMRGNILMARVITRDQALSVTTREGMLSTVQNWTPSLTRRTARDWVSRTENFLSLLKDAAAEEEKAARTAA